MEKKIESKMMDGFEREVLLKGRTMAFALVKLQRASEPRIHFPAFLG